MQKAATVDDATVTKHIPLDTFNKIKAKLTNGNIEIPEFLGILKDNKDGFLRLATELLNN